MHCRSRYDPIVNIRSADPYHCVSLTVNAADWRLPDSDTGLLRWSCSRGRASLATQPNTSWQLTSLFRDSVPWMKPLEKAVP